MATVFIVYDSKTGNTGRMPEAIAEGAKAAGAEVLVRKLGQKFTMEELTKADAILFGSPTAGRRPFVTSSIGVPYNERVVDRTVDAKDRIVKNL
jgi:flavodoxin